MIMSNYFRLISAIATLWCASALVQAQPSGATANQDITSFVSVVGITQLNTGLNSGGNFNWSYASASAGFLNNVSPATTLGVSVRYGSEFWNWNNMQGYSLAGKNPWSTILSPSASFIYSHKLDADWKLNVTPTIESAAEQGANINNSLTYGAVLNAAKKFSPTLNLGLGAGVFRQIDTNRVFPFLVVDWKISERWNLNNPFPGGPTGGAGLELTYAATPQFKVSGGAAYKSYRFRLNNSSAYSEGIGQNRFIPVFAKFSYAFDRTTLLDLYTIANVGGSVSAIDANGNTALSTNYKTAPAFALNLVKRF
jgi:hypothetical protein